MKLTKKYIFKCKLSGQPIKLKKFNENDYLDLLLETEVFLRKGDMIRVNHPIIVPMRKNSSEPWTLVNMKVGASIHKSNLEW